MNAVRRLSRQRGNAQQSRSATVIDLRPYCDRSPYVVNEQLPLRRVFRLFTVMGLRHLCVVDAHSLVVGMITRKDFMHINPHDVRRLSLQRRDETRKRLERAGESEITASRQKQRSPNRLSRASRQSSGASPNREMRRSPGSLRRQLSSGALSFGLNMTPCALRRTTTGSRFTAPPEYSTDHKQESFAPHVR